MTYTDVFGNNTVPPSDYGYRAVTLAATTQFNWPYNATSDTTAKLMEVSASSAGLSMKLPDATEVSNGEDLLIRNTGANTFSVTDTSGGAVATVASGAAVYIYLTDNSTAAGVWGLINYGVGTSTVDAATLIGYGILAIGSTLNQSHPVVSTATGITVGSTHRAKLINFTGGADTMTLASVSTLGDNFFTLIRNSGTGTLTHTPNGADTIDGQSSFLLQPGESAILVCSGTGWFTVGYGRAVAYNFTQLVLDVSAAGTFTLTAAQAANKLLTFVGAPASAVTVVVPNVVNIYYTLSSISTTQTITVKTAAGSGSAIAQGVRAILICDATNVYSAQSATASTTLQLLDGSASVPALSFASQTNTGIYKYGSAGFGVAVAGADAFHYDSGVLTVAGALSGTLSLPQINDTTGDHQYVFAVSELTADRTVTLPLLTGNDTFTFNAFAATLTNKTINLTSNTLTGTKAQFDAACSDEDFAYQSDITTMLVDADIGVSVQGYDAATAKTNADQSWTGSPRATPVTDNDGSFDMNAGLDFLCTPTAGFTLTFTNIAQGQRGSIYLVNGSNYTIAAAATTKVTSTLLSSISATGEYWLSYWSPDGTNVLVTHAGDFA